MKQQILEILKVMCQIAYHVGFAPLDSPVTILVFSSNSLHFTNALLWAASNNFQFSHLVAIQVISLENTQEHEAFTFTQGARYKQVDRRQIM